MSLEAYSWYDSIGELLTYDQPYLGPSLLRMGQIHEERGERQKAVRCYSQFVDLWKDCDPGYRPLREEAEQGLARLGRGIR